MCAMFRETSRGQYSTHSLPSPPLARRIKRWKDDQIPRPSSSGFSTFLITYKIMDVGQPEARGKSGADATRARSAFSDLSRVEGSTEKTQRDKQRISTNTFPYFHHSSQPFQN